MLQKAGVNLANDKQDILLSTYDGKCLRFPVKSIRLFSGLNSGGVKGIKLDKSNFVISFSVLHHSYIDMSIRQKYLKYARSDIWEYRIRENYPNNKIG